MTNTASPTSFYNQGTTVYSTDNGSIADSITAENEAAASAVAAAASAATAAAANNGEVVAVIDGSGAAITTGVKVDIPVGFACIINSMTMVADQNGSIVVDIWKAPFASFPPTSSNSITASDKPTLSSAQSVQDTALTGWTVNIKAGDVLRFNVNSAATVTRVTIILQVTKT